MGYAEQGAVQPKMVDDIKKLKQENEDLLLDVKARESLIKLLKSYSNVLEYERDSYKRMFFIMFIIGVTSLFFQVIK